MKIEKIQPETLLQLLLDVFKNAPQFKYISGIQPFLMSFGQQKYYVYVKNLSSAYFKERPDTTRAQLPKRDEFEQIKQSPLPFIFFGYDQINDVLVCWNYHIAKSRLNEKESVSFYSRTFFQEEVVEGEFLRKRLKNDDVPVLFKRKDIVTFFEQIDSFFPLVETSENQDTEVEETQPIMAPINVNKKITEITDKGLLQQLKPLLAINSPHTLEAIKLVQSHYGNMPAMKFRDWAKLIKSVTFNNPNQTDYSTENEEPIRSVAEPVTKYSTFSNEREFIKYMETHLSDKSIDHYLTALSGRISDEIRAKLYPQLNDIFTINDVRLLSDWITKLLIDTQFAELDRIGKNMYSCALKKYIQFLQQYDKTIDLSNTDEEINGRKKTQILRVTFPDGRVIEERMVLNTLAYVIEYAGIENVHKLKIMVNGTNLLSDTVPDLYNNSKQHILGDYVLMTCSNTETKYRQIKQISEALGLNLKVEKVSII